MNENEIDKIEFTQVDFCEGKFKLHNIVYDSPEGETIGVYYADVFLVHANSAIWYYNDLGYRKLCDADEVADIFSDGVRLYIWAGNIYTCLQGLDTLFIRTVVKSVDEYIQKSFGPWYFNKGQWKHVMSGKSVFGGYDVEYATYSCLETTQVNNAIIADTFIKLTQFMDRKRVIEICRKYIMDENQKAAIDDFISEFQYNL